ncbi:hypothetical protein XELAEV_18011057mg [Xenopus laevis]|uniref:Alpha-protein kinase 2 n=1 Tax=Xenopus laevis TaxID=8355 RepID=A0A974I1V7_XENLA|nr:hypothetical protein XELAEV_18011057mg [Xenopus laevis]
MEEFPNTEGPKYDQTLNIDSFIEYLMGIPGDQSSENENWEENNENSLILDAGTDATQHSKQVLDPINTQKTAVIGNKENKESGDKFFTCHTHNMDRVYCTWLGTNYWYMYAKPYWDTQLPSEEELFDDRLNYLECSDVMTDYTNGILEPALLDSDPRSLLESDQCDETKQSLDYLNGCDLAPSGVTALNEVSDNSVDEEGAFTGLSQTPPQPTEEAVLSRDRLEALHVKSKERCKLPFSAAAIQNDQAGIEEDNKENSLVGELSTHDKQFLGHTLVEHLSANSIDTSVNIKCMNPRTDEHMETSLIPTSPGTETASEKQYLEEIKFMPLGENGPSKSPEVESNQKFYGISLTDINRALPSQSKEKNEGQDYKKTADAVSKLLEQQVANKCRCNMECPAGRNSKENTALTVTSGNKLCSLLSKKSSQLSPKYKTSTEVSGNDINGLPIIQNDCSFHKPNIMPKDISLTLLKENTHYTQPFENKDILGESVFPGSQFSSADKSLGKMEKGTQLTESVNVKGSLDSKTHENVVDTLAGIKRNTEQGSNPCYKNTDYGGMFSRGVTDQLKMNFLDITKKAKGLPMQELQTDKIPDAKRRPSNQEVLKDSQPVNLKPSKNVSCADNSIPIKGKAPCSSSSTKTKGKPSRESLTEGLQGTEQLLQIYSGNLTSNRELLNGGVICKVKLGKSTASTTLTSKPEEQGSSGGTEHKDSDEDDNADDIPNSQELLFISEDSDVYQTIELDTRKDSSQKPQGLNTLANELQKPSGSQTPVDMLEIKVENNTTKRTLNVQGKESCSHSNIHDEQTLGVKEELPGDKEKLVKKEDKMETSASSGKSKDNKAPKLLHNIQAEKFPDYSGNLKLFCQFRDIHEDSTVTWTKDSKLLARMHRSSSDDSPVSLAIVQMSTKDQGIYLCTLKNAHGKISSEFHLTFDVLEQLSLYPEAEGGEEIEFNQLLFREDFITDMYFGGNLHGRIATEDLHFGEGVHRKAFRSKVMCGLFPVFNPGHLCVLKVHNAIAYGTKNIDELVQRNYKLAVQECYVQNTAREYAKIYAGEAEQLEDFGKVPEIIPIFLIHRPANNIPYATVEEELIGDFVKYSVKDGKEINVLRRDSEAGQKCCTFQHWVYEKTNGNLLVTDMQGVGMKLTDVGIATLSKGYKGFKGNCSVSFIDQFKALHQCNKYCEILGLKSLKANPTKPKKASPAKERTQPSTVGARKSKNGPKPKHKT